MDTERKVNRQALIVGLVALGLGLIIGLVVLGWWLFPVQWSEFSPEQMGPADQEEWLRMAIDSMIYKYDTVAARTRFEYLGEDGPAILAAIQANPAPLTEESVQAFSAIVQAEPPPQAAAPTSTLRPFIILLLALVVIALVVWIAYRLIRRQPGPAEALPPADFPLEEVQPEPDLDVETVVFAEGETEGSTEAIPEEVLEEEAPEAESPQEVAGDGEMPGADTGLRGQADFGVGTAAAAAMAAAALHEEPEEPAAEISEIPVADIAAAGVTAGLVAESAEGGETVEEAPPEIPQEVAGPGLPEETGAPAVEAGAPRMPTDLAYVEGIGAVYAQKLKEIGVNTPEQLLNWGATPRGRQAIAEQSGISPKLLLTWINHIDLYRIRGIGSEYAELLEASGVDTVLELAARNPAHLYQALVALNEAKKLVRKLPVQSQVDDWVRQAKGLPRVVTY